MCQLLALVHDDCLWLGDSIPIDIDLIHRISNLPCQGEDPVAAFGGKGLEQKVSDIVKEKYKVSCHNQGFFVSEINDRTIQFGTLILACNMMRRFWSKEVLAHVIALAKQCEKGIH